MIGLDTNVLIRYITQDDAKQSPVATTLIESLTVESPGYLGTVSVVELVWVPGGCYGSSKSKIAEVLKTLLRTKEIIVEHADIVWKAVRVFKKGKANFADCLIERSANAAGCSDTTTFDRGTAKHCGMRLIGRAGSALFKQSEPQPGLCSGIRIPAYPCKTQQLHHACRLVAPFVELRFTQQDVMPVTSHPIVNCQRVDALAPRRGRF